MEEIRSFHSQWKKPGFPATSSLEAKSLVLVSHKKNNLWVVLQCHTEWKAPSLLRVESRRQTEEPEEISDPETGEMVQLAKCIPHKHRNLSSVFKIQMKRSVTVFYALTIPALETWRQNDM